MASGTRPNNWIQIQRAIKNRAEYRCECGTFWECQSNNHFRRCPNIEGNRYPHNKRQIKLRVVQIGALNDWRPDVLIALCLPCHGRWVEIRTEQERQRMHTRELEAQMDPLF